MVLERTERRDVARIALAHDYLTQRGGAERVTSVLCEAFPGRPLFTSVFEPSQTFSSFEHVDVHTTWLQHVRAFRHDPRRAVALLAPAFSSLHVNADVVVASSSGWAHGIGTDAKVLVYCHAPARWLYQAARYQGDVPGRFSTAAKLAGSALRRPLTAWDQKAARRADRYVVNSSAIARQVKSVYGIEAQVVAPPPALEPIGASTAVRGIEEGFVLTVSRLLPYKNVGTVLDLARRRPSQQFVVVGQGPLAGALARDAPRNVVLLGTVSESELRWLYANAVALLAPSYEDFGLTPLEAASFATPTVALRAGGYLDTIIEGETGTFFDTLDVTAVDDALAQLLRSPPSVEALTTQARRFSRATFIDRLHALVDELL